MEQVKVVDQDRMLITCYLQDEGSYTSCSFLANKRYFNDSQELIDAIGHEVMDAIRSILERYSIIKSDDTYVQ